MLYVIPSLSATVVMTSDPTEPSREDNYVGQLHALVTDGIVPALLPRPDNSDGSVGANGQEPSE